MLHCSKVPGKASIIGCSDRELRPLKTMLSHIKSPDFAASDCWTVKPDPVAAVLIEALHDCVHPRSGRLRAQLQGCTDAAQLEHLRGEVFNLLAMSFGPAEAERRLSALQ